MTMPDQPWENMLVEAEVPCRCGSTEYVVSGWLPSYVMPGKWAVLMKCHNCGEPEFGYLDAERLKRIRHGVLTNA